MSIKQQLVSGVFWKGLERIFAQVVSLVISIVLARILVPDDYSVVSIVAIFFTFCNIFITGGLSTALIQKKNADALDYSTVLIANELAAAVLYAIMYFSAPFIASLYEKPILQPVIRVMSLSFFVVSLKSVICAKVSSEMAFKKFFFATFIGTVISAVLGVVMAKKGCGAWALVAQQMSNSVIDTIVLALVTKIGFSFRFSFERLKGLFSYAWKLTCTSLIAAVYQECNPLIVGLRFSTTDLAFYNKGDSFPKIMNQVGTNTLSATLFPALSKMQDDKKAVLAFTRRYIRTASFVVFPLMAGLMAVSRSFVQVLLTDKWLPIVPYMMIFSVAHAFELVHVGNLQAIKAIGRSDVILKMEIIKKTVYFVIIALFVWLSDSPIALACTALLTTLWAIIVNTFPTRKMLDYRLKYQVMDVLPNFMCACVMFFAVYMLRNLPINKYIMLPLQITAGAVIYAGLALITKNESFGYLLNMAKDKLKKK